MKKYGPEQIREALSQDPLADAEKIAGAPYDKDESVAGLGLLLMQRKATALRRMLESTNDVSFGCKLPQYLAVVDSLGFEQVLCESFAGRHGVDTFYAYYRRPGQLLIFDTYGDQLNGGKLHYAWRPKPDEATQRSCSRYLESGHWHAMTREIWCGDHDCREALRFHIDALEANGTFVEPWPDAATRHVWLLTYMEVSEISKAAGSDWKKQSAEFDRVIAERRQRLPQDVRTRLGLS